MRRTNVGLLLLLPLAFGTGWLAFAFGTPLPAFTVVTLHGLAGVGVLVLSPWKSVIVRRGLRRVRPDRWASIGLAVLVMVVVATGLAHAAGLAGPVLGITTMQTHVGAALVALPLAAWHVLRRPSRPRRTDLSRRSLLRVGGVVGVTGIVWGGAELVLGADRRFSGSHERGSGNPAAMPVTQWLFDPVPRIDPGAWRLRVGGAELSLADLDPRDRVRATLDCTGGWFAEQEWAGLHLDRLLSTDATARSILVRSATGYARRFPIADLDRLLLATTCAGRPLSPGHGAPARLVAPGRRGFWWVKWVTTIELSDAPAWRQPPFPLQ